MIAPAKANDNRRVQLLCMQHINAHLSENMDQLSGAGYQIGGTRPLTTGGNF